MTNAMTAGYRKMRTWWTDLTGSLVEYRLRASQVKHTAGVGGAGRLWLQYPRWRKGLRPHGSPLEDGIPWITYGAISFLEEYLQPSMRVFEFGSGGSTIFFARRVREVFTAEHDPGWGERVSRELERRGLLHTRVLVCEPEIASPLAEADPADPQGYRSSDEDFLDRDFRSYASSIDQFPEEHFDLIAIDGRARPSCFAHALARLRPGGYLVLDNAERDHYHRIHETLATLGWARNDFNGPGPYNRTFWSTCAWKKPSR